MTVKRLLPIASFALFFALALPASATVIAPPPVSTAITTTPVDNPRAEELLLRVKEIRDMDKSALSATEKKALRKELRDIRREVRHSRGVYLSVGAIIIILLLIIIL